MTTEHDTGNQPSFIEDNFITLDFLVEPCWFVDKKCLLVRAISPRYEFFFFVFVHESISAAIINCLHVKKVEFFLGNSLQLESLALLAEAISIISAVFLFVT
jgi:hypothetical protein